MTKKQKELYEAHEAQQRIDGEDVGRLNEVITKTERRANGTLRVRHYYDNCPTLAEQHTAHLSDINYLMERYKPDELASYIAARAAHRQEIIGHDFSREPSLQDAKNVVYRSRQEFEKLPDEVRTSFKNHLEFLKFIDNPANAEKMVKLGLITKKQIETIQIPENPLPKINADKDVQDEDKAKK